ncbi:10096_t:CDS:2, partial [Ambispora leptoticha]
MFNYFPLWVPSPGLKNLLDQFQTKLLFDYPSIPCAHCSMLMLESAVVWIPYDQNKSYMLSQIFPNLNLPLRVNRKNDQQIAVCNSYKNQRTRHYPPLLSSIPSEINDVPMFHRRYLSPVHLDCLLGRTANSNYYTNYHYLKGSINISHNYRLLELYSGLIGAYLNTNELLNWFHNSLIPASNWLKQNNTLIQKYASDIIISDPRPGDSIPLPLPLARQSIVDPTPFSNLPGSILNNQSRFPILFDNPDLEALMFPDLFPTGRGHYEDIKKLLNFQPSIDSYRKYIKLRMLYPNPRFRLH